jgi:DNA-binding HxlR family transcriptional regulator
MAKTYGQFCSIARALDLVGDRWALLVVRELLLGARRFTDLRSGLPGIGTNVLATRLRELEAAGVIERRQLPAPAPALIYQLTERGERLREVIDALARWGAPLLDLDAHRDPGGHGGDGADTIEPRWFALSLEATVDAGALDEGTTLELDIDGERFTMAVEAGHLVARHRPDGPATADTTLTGPLADWFAAARGDRRAAARLRIDGDRSIARTFLALLSGTPAPAR